jgi:hypothetical protein
MAFIEWWMGVHTPAKVRPAAGALQPGLNFIAANLTRHLQCGDGLRQFCGPGKEAARGQRPQQGTKKNPVNTNLTGTKQKTNTMNKHYS